MKAIILTVFATLACSNAMMPIEIESPILPQRTLATKDLVEGEIICFSNNSKDSDYGIGQNMYVMGRVTLEGSFNEENIFEPDGYEGEDISKADQFKDTCNKNFPACQEGCWAGGAKKTTLFKPTWGKFPTFSPFFGGPGPVILP